MSQTLISQCKGKTSNINAAPSAMSNAFLIGHIASLMNLCSNFTIFSTNESFPEPAIKKGKIVVGAWSGRICGVKPKVSSPCTWTRTAGPSQIFFRQTSARFRKTSVAKTTKKKKKNWFTTW
jgi:hypothetical protein